jgi:exodeoxyribonuclease-3
VRLATWNVNSLKARLSRVEEWIATVQPDVLCLQETKLADSAFPAMAFAGLGYEAAHHGEGRWNGVALLSKVGLDDVRPGFGEGHAAADARIATEARFLSAVCGGVRVGTAYVPNGREPGHEHFHYKLAWLAALRDHLDDLGSPGDDLVLAGDFNVAPDDRDVWDPAAFAGDTHVTPEERAALGHLEEWGLVDVFRRHHEPGGLFSWWDYRAGNFHKGKGMRIDLVLATSPLAARSTSVLIDRNARKGTGPSDHAPVIVDFAATEPKGSP